MAIYHTNNDVTIEFHVPDLEVVKAFYGKLGFTVLRDEPPTVLEAGFLILELGKTRLQFTGGGTRILRHSYFKRFPKGTPLAYGVEVILPVADVDAFYAKAQAVAPDAILEPLKSREWGDQDFRMQDPNGVYLRVTSV